MGSKKALAALTSGDPKKWQDYLDHERPTDTEGNISGGDNGKYADFQREDLSGLNLDNYNLSDVYFGNANLSKCSFRGAYFRSSVITQCLLHDTDFTGATFTSCSVRHNECNKQTLFKNVQVSGHSNFTGKFESASFKDASLTDVDFRDASFLNADLTNCKLRRAQLGGTSWQGALIDEHTDIQLARFDNHPVTRDKSHLIRYTSPLRKWIFNWKMTRSIGQLPLFGVSWLLFLTSLLLINTIGTLNEIRPPIIEGLGDIPIPAQMGWIILSTLLLATGSTLYVFFCPEQIKEFSEAQWVYEHGHPRIEYSSQSLQKRFIQALTIIALLIGGTIGLWLVCLRVIDAIQYVLR